MCCFCLGIDSLVIISFLSVLGSTHCYLYWADTVGKLSSCKVCFKLVGFQVLNTFFSGKEVVMWNGSRSSSRGGCEYGNSDMALLFPFLTSHIMWAASIVTYMRVSLPNEPRPSTVENSQLMPVQMEPQWLRLPEWKLFLWTLFLQNKRCGFVNFFLMLTLP